MKTDNKIAEYFPIGFTVLNLNTLVIAVNYDYFINNHRNGGYTIVMGNGRKPDMTENKLLN